MISKVIIVPDVHGRTFWRLAKEKVDEVDKIVFLGDYLDPYPAEGITTEDAIKEFEEIIEFKKNYNDKVILLYGNHDCHYSDLSIHITPCSRYDRKNANRIEEIFKDNKDLFQLLYKTDRYLFSHAGVIRDWMVKECNCVVLSALLRNQNLAYDHLWDISTIRGGYYQYGSCVWSDVREFVNQYSGVYQIFGHTQLSKEYFGTTFACLDCRKCFILDINEQTIEELL